MATVTHQRLATYCVRGQAITLTRDGSHRVYTIHTVALQARTYSQARWWGVKLLRWRGVPFVRVSLRREPSNERDARNERDDVR